MEKEKIMQTILLVIMVLAITLFLYTLINYNALRENVSEKIEKYGYFGVAIMSFFLDGFPQFLSADIALIGGGLIGLNIFTTFLIVSSSSALAGMILYGIGYSKGKKVVKLFIGEEKYKKFNSLSKTKGKIAVTLAALSPIPYLPILIGALKIHPYDFLIYGVIMRTMRFALIAYLFHILIS